MQEFKVKAKMLGMSEERITTMNKSINTKV